MNLIVCVDDRMGMSFNHRRQSQDRVLRENMLEMVGNSKLWMNAYSAKQFSTQGENFRIAEDFFNQLGKDDFCFVEFIEDLPEWGKVEEIVVYHWNRTYPFDLDQQLKIPDNFHVKATEEFAGRSHEKITKEVYVR